MNLKEYVDGLNRFLAENPEMAELEVITANITDCDTFSRVVAAPEAGNLFLEEHFIPVSDDGYFGEINAVCVN